MEQELLTLPEHMSSPPVFNAVRVTRSLLLCVCFVYRCLSFCPFSFGVVCSSIYGFCLPLWYLQTLLTTRNKRHHGACISSTTHLVNLIAFNDLQLAQLEKLSFLIIFFINLSTLKENEKKHLKKQNCYLCLETSRWQYNSTSLILDHPTTGYLSYHARLLMNRDSKILPNYFHQERPPLLYGCLFIAEGVVL